MTKVKVDPTVETFSPSRGIEDSWVPACVLTSPELLESDVIDVPDGDEVKSPRTGGEMGRNEAAEEVGWEATTSVGDDSAILETAEVTRAPLEGEDWILLEASVMPIWAGSDTEVDCVRFPVVVVEEIESLVDSGSVDCCDSIPVRMVLLGKG